MKNFCLLMLVLLFNNIITAQPVKGSIEVWEGWNLIGALSTGPVSGISPIITTDPPGIITGTIFEYDSEVPGYGGVTELIRGKGYWTKVTADGVLNFLSPCGGDIGRIYNTIKIGDQCWLRDNLDVGNMIDGSLDQTNNGVLEKYCYNNNPTNCSNYGALYQWDEAMNYVGTPGAQGICPDGWHMPTLAEFQTLAATVGNSSNALKEVGQSTGTNTSGFTGLLAGYRESGSFIGLGSHALFWSSTGSGSTANYMGLFFNTNTIHGVNGSPIDINTGYSVRCIQD